MVQLAIPEGVMRILSSKTWLQVSNDPDHPWVRVQDGFADKVYHRDASYDAPAGLVDGMLSYLTRPSFAGGLVWITRVIPAISPEVVVLKQILRGLGVEGINFTGAIHKDEFRRLALSFAPEEYPAMLTMLSLCILFGFRGIAVTNDPQILIETDECKVTVSTPEGEPLATQIDEVLKVMSFTEITVAR